MLDRLACFFSMKWNKEYGTNTISYLLRFDGLHSHWKNLSLNISLSFSSHWTSLKLLSSSHGWTIKLGESMALNKFTVSVFVYFILWSWNVFSSGSGRFFMLLSWFQEFIEIERAFIISSNISDKYSLWWVIIFELKCHRSQQINLERLRETVTNKNPNRAIESDVAYLWIAQFVFSVLSCAKFPSVSRPSEAIRTIRTKNFCYEIKVLDLMLYSYEIVLVKLTSCIANVVPVLYNLCYQLNVTRWQCRVTSQLALRSMR